MAGYKRPRTYAFIAESEMPRNATGKVLHRELKKQFTTEHVVRSTISFRQPGDMHAVLNSALPIFALILTGFICGHFGVFDCTATDNLNRFAVYLALPSLMFVAMSKITPDQVRQFGFVGAFCGGFAVSFALGFGFSRLRGRRVANASIEGLDAGYSNVGFMGIPMCLLVFGPDSAPASIIATLFTACVLFLFAIVVIEIDLQKGDRFWPTGAKCSSRCCAARC